VKEKSRPKNQKLKSNFTGSNLILNSIILLLGILVIFLTFSLVNRLTSRSSEQTDNGKEAASSVIQVEVLNGCGVTGVAEKFTDYLRKEKFDVVQMGNYISFDIDKSLVIDRTGNMANAEKVAAALGIDKKNVIMQKNDDSFLDVSVVIGKDYKKLNQ
jgi:flagellar biosynthesis/type III secretory pathway M-ring protein FliF/YscJ